MIDQTQFHKGHTYPARNADTTPRSDIRYEQWGNRIECHGDTEAEAEEMRDFVLKAIKAYRGQHAD